MLRHIVLLTLHPSAVPERRDAIVAAVSQLPGSIPEISAYHVGVDAGLAEDNATIAIVGEFADVAAYETYRDHPAHVQVIRELILPVLERRSAAQIEY